MLVTGLEPAKIDALIKAGKKLLELSILPGGYTHVQGQSHNRYILFVVPNHKFIQAPYLGVPATLPWAQENNSMVCSGKLEPWIELKAISLRK